MVHTKLYIVLKSINNSRQCQFKLYSFTKWKAQENSENTIYDLYVLWLLRLAHGPCLFKSEVTRTNDSHKSFTFEFICFL